MVIPAIRCERMSTRVEEPDWARLLPGCVSLATRDVLLRYPSEWDPRKTGTTRGGYLEGRIRLPKVRHLFGKLCVHKKCPSLIFSLEILQPPCEFSLVWLLG